MPPSASPPRRPRSADRHRARKTISFPPELLDLLAQLAERNKRPLSWEAKLAIERHLREAKMLPPEAG